MPLLCLISHPLHCYCYFSSLQASVSFHSYGQYVLYPWGYSRVVPPDHQDLKRVGDKIAAAIAANGGGNYRVGPAAATLYPASGKKRQETQCRLTNVGDIIAARIFRGISPEDHSSLPDWNNRVY